MSRSGYVDCEDIDESILNLYRGAVASAIRGKRGQAMLKRIICALDAMPVKELCASSFGNSSGQFCALGSVANAESIRLDAFFIDDGQLYTTTNGDPTNALAQTFGIARCLAAEIMYLNDEYFVQEFEDFLTPLVGPHLDGVTYPETRWKGVRNRAPNAPKQRWQAMRAWAIENLKKKDV